MEDYCPPRFKHRGLTHQQHLGIFRSLLTAQKFSHVSLTGGEPLINLNLHDYAAVARPLTERLELNTNGLLLSDVRWNDLGKFFDRVKISLDTVDSELFRRVTKAAGKDPLGKVLNAIKLVRQTASAELAVNCVVSIDTIPRLKELIEWAQSNEIRLHLLDFYFSEERRSSWSEKFVPLEDIMVDIERHLGPPRKEPTFGCSFYEFGSSTGSIIRVKTSFSGTMRSDKCRSCSQFCQEGVYGLKLSRDGWVTYCPSNREEDGVLLESGMSPDEVASKIKHLVQDIQSACLMTDSFSKMLEVQGASPLSLVHISKNRKSIVGVECGS